MKKTYIRPEIEITSFTTEDVITASSPSSGGMINGGTTVSTSTSATASGSNIGVITKT